MARGRRPTARSWRSRRTSPLTTAGVDGEIPLVARENATKVELSDAESDIDMTRTAVEDDFAGRIYDSAVDGATRCTSMPVARTRPRCATPTTRSVPIALSRPRRPRDPVNRSESTGPKLARPRSPGSSPTWPRRRGRRWRRLRPKAATTIATTGVLAAARMAPRADRRTRYTGSNAPSPPRSTTPSGPRNAPVRGQRGNQSPTGERARADRSDSGTARGGA